MEKLDEMCKMILRCFAEAGERGLGWNEARREAGRLQGKKEMPRETFITHFNELKKQGLIRLREVGKQRKKIYEITELGKAKLSDTLLLEKVEEIWWTTGGEALKKLLSSLLEQKEWGVEVEGAEVLPNVHINLMWLQAAHRETGEPIEIRKPILLMSFSREFNKPYAKINENKKSQELFQNILAAFIEALLQKYEHLIPLALQLDEKNRLKNYRSLRQLGGAFADHFLQTLEGVVNAPEQAGWGVAIAATWVVYNPSLDVLALATPSLEVSNKLQSILNSTSLKDLTFERPLGSI
jgi:DNA-binding transcriptional ArsR family regulator